MYIEKNSYKLLVLSLSILISVLGDQFKSTDSKIQVGKNGSGGSAYFNDGITDYTKAGIIIGSVFGFIFLIAGIILCKIKKSGMPRWFPCHKYNKLKKYYNIVDCETFTKEEYLMQRDQFIKLINDSIYQNTFYLQKGKERIYEKIQAEIVDQKPFITELKINGRHQNDIWKAVGFILSRNKQIFFWLYRYEANKSISGKDANKNHLVYETLKNDLDQVKGKWFYCGFQQIDQCTGFWYLLNKKKQMSAKSQSITNMKNHLRKDSSSSRFGNLESF